MDDQPADNRMRFLRLLETPEQRDFCSEIEFASECQIQGELRYRSDNLFLRPLTFESNRDGLFKYVLSLRAPAGYRLPFGKGSEKGYYFNGSTADEILSLASLFLRCRFFSVAYTHRDIGGFAISKYEADFVYTLPRRNADRNLFDASRRNFVDLAGFFDQIQRLPVPLHYSFANATRLYALAVREVGVDDQLAYIHLVSAIETLCQDQPLSTQQDPLQTVIDKLKAVLDSETAEVKYELGNLLKQRKSIARFVAFIAAHAMEAVPERPTENALENKIYRNTLPDVLRRIYRARSKFLHEGASMYLSTPGAFPAEWDFDATLGRIIDNRVFSGEDKLPYISFFERIVHACLLAFLQQHTTADAS